MDGRVQKVFLFSGEGQPRKGGKGRREKKKKLNLNQDRLITGSYVTRSDVVTSPMPNAKNLLAATADRVDGYGV